MIENCLVDFRISCFRESTVDASSNVKVRTKIKVRISVSRPVGSHSEVRGSILAGSTNIFAGPLWGVNF